MGSTKRRGQSITARTPPPRLGGRRERRERTQREREEEERNNLSERNEEEEPSVGGGAVGREGRMDGGRGGAITAVSSVTDLHRPLHSHSPPALINGIIEQCGIPLKFLLRFHKKKKSNCGEVMNAPPPTLAQTPRRDTHSE